MGLIGKSADRLSLTWTDSDFFILARALFEPSAIFFLPVTDAPILGGGAWNREYLCPAVSFYPNSRFTAMQKFTYYLEVEILQLLLLLDVQIVIRPEQRSGISRTGLFFRCTLGSQQRISRKKGKKGKLQKSKLRCQIIRNK